MNYEKSQNPAALRRAEQRTKWKTEGWTEITVRVAIEHAAAAKHFIKNLPPPSRKES